MATKPAARKTSGKARQTTPTSSLPATLDASIEALATVSAEQERLQTRETELAAQIKEANRQKRLAAYQDDYEKAAELKKQVEALEASATTIRTALSSATGRRGELAEHTAALYFETAHTAADLKGVTRVVVVDPRTRDSDEAYYLEGDDTIQLHLGEGRNFESEAWHVDNWAMENGLLVQRRKRTVDFGGVN